MNALSFVLKSPLSVTPLLNKMVIIGITGTLSSGKETAAKYLQLMHGFIVYNLESQDWEDSFPSNA